MPLNMPRRCIETVRQFIRCLDRDHRRHTGKLFFMSTATGLFTVDLIAVAILPAHLPVVSVLHVLHTPVSAWAGFLGMLVVFCEEPRR